MEFKGSIEDPIYERQYLCKGETIVENKYANYTLEEKVKAAVELIMLHIDMQHFEKNPIEKNPNEEYVMNELTELYNSL